MCRSLHLNAKPHHIVVFTSSSTVEIMECESDSDHDACDRLKTAYLQNFGIFLITTPVTDCIILSTDGLQSQMRIILFPAIPSRFISLVVARHIAAPVNKEDSLIKVPRL